MPVMSMLAVLSWGAMSYHIDVRTSPGPLSAAQPHGEALGGFTSHADFHHECNHCHAPMHCVSPNRCQECHIKESQESHEGTGLHGLLPGTDRCQNCHVEHQGSDVVISALPFDNIDHERLTGFSLDTHRSGDGETPATCVDCHAQHRFNAEAVDCVTCHAKADSAFVAEHTEVFGEKCFDCHDGVDRMVNFDHAQVFALEGAHGDVACEECHVDQMFVGTPQECVACHEDPEVHAGQFGLDCSRCHTASAWTPAQLTRHVFLLDHGDEGEIPCETCHVGSYTEYTCYADCHAPEQMQADHDEADKQDGAAFENCAECHPTGREGEGERSSNGN